jgi:hypothetical protein
VPISSALAHTVILFFGHPPDLIRASTSQARTSLQINLPGEAR